MLLAGIVGHIGRSCLGRQGSGGGLNMTGIKELSSPSGKGRVRHVHVTDKQAQSQQQAAAAVTGTSDPHAYPCN